MKAEVIYESTGSSRVISVEMNGKTLMTPTYFPAISSFGIKYSFRSLVNLFLVYKYPRILISAYDLYFLPSKIRDEIKTDIKEYFVDNFVFLDSGVFESFWKADKRWNPSLHKKATSMVAFDFFSSYDILPNKKSKKFVEKTIEGILHSENVCKRTGFIPVIHGNPNELVLATGKLAQRHPHLCSFIAVPERDCGESVVEKAQTINKIRKELDAGSKKNHGRILHLLGCGDPLSMLLFLFNGANSFDSLDWIKYSIEPDRLRMNNFSHIDLINCDCPICNGPRRPYVERVFLHNLLFYQNFILQIQIMLRENSLKALLEKYFSQDILEKMGAE